MGLSETHRIESGNDGDPAVYGASSTRGGGEGVSKKTIPVAGLLVNVFGLDELSSPDAGVPRPQVTALFFLHGRKGSANHEQGVARQLYADIVARRQKEGGTEAGHRDLVVIAFDQRNHGKRKVDEGANASWKEGNEMHAQDMYGMFLGTASDVSFLIDFLPSYLFPNDEREIIEWACVGKSLGGHATWVVLKDDPRVRVGVPLIGSPDYLKLLNQRAKSSGRTLESPTLPLSLLWLVKSKDPAFSQFDVEDGKVNPFWGKKILICSGADDKLVRWSYSEEFVTKLILGPDGQKKVVLEPGVGHEVTQSMLNETAEWVWQWAVRAEPNGGAGRAGAP